MEGGERKGEREEGREEGRERERERDLVNFETEFHAWLRGGLQVTVHCF